MTVFDTFEKTTILPLEFLPLNHLFLFKSFLWVNWIGNLFLNLVVFLEAPEVTPRDFKEIILEELINLDSNFRNFYYF